MASKIPHIKVDAFPIVDTHFSGVGHYTLGIIRGFDELAAEGKLTYDLIVPFNRKSWVNKYHFENYRKIIRNPIPQKVLRQFMKMHLDVPVDWLLGPGRYWFPSFLAWPTWGSKSSVVIHDVTYLAVPECVHEGNRKYLTRTVPFSLSNSQNVICVSEFSKSEIIKYYEYPEDNIFVASPSIDRRLFYKRSPEEIRSVRLKYDIYDEDYILSVGNIEPRKNYLRLIEAFMKMPDSITKKYTLVIIGAGGWNNEDIKAKIQEAKEKGLKIINPGKFVPDEDMPALYSGARFFAFTPIYEGFGMSPLEAYATGTPVLASNVASVPEAAGNAAVYCDPFDIDDIAEKMEYMFKETEANRDKWKKEIDEHLGSLNWRKSAETTAAALTGLPVSHFASKESKK